MSEQDDTAERDPRVRRTRAALRQAFNTVVLSGGYEVASPASIAKAAGVGRSTFYEHYSGKDDLLRESVTEALTPLAIMSKPFSRISGEIGAWLMF
jgi:AcrR family transcriptional regulator